MSITRQEFKTKMRKALGGEQYDRRISEGWRVIECRPRCGYTACEGWRFEASWEAITRESPVAKPRVWKNRDGITIVTGTMDDSTFPKPNTFPQP